jgi:hypothetical protein
LFGQIERGIGKNRIHGVAFYPGKKIEAIALIERTQIRPIGKAFFYAPLHDPGGYMMWFILGL